MAERAEHAACGHLIGDLNMSLRLGGAGVTPSNKLGFGNRLSLAAGETWTIAPAGPYWVQPGPYTMLQVFDPILSIWVPFGNAGAWGGTGPIYIESDAVNYRLANLTGQPVGALLTNVGSGYTSAPAVTISAGNSIWRSIVGGSVATPTISNAGANYTYAPTVTFSAPPAGGVPATGIAVLSGGTLSSITMVNVGAGYTSAPLITITNDPREGVNNVVAGAGASAITTLTASGKVTAILCVDPGNTGYTSVPSFTFSGGGGSSLAATPIMCWTILSFTPGGTNTGWGTTLYPMLSGLDTLGTITITAGSTNPAIQQNLVQTRAAQILGYAATTALANTGSVFIDGGIYTTIPKSIVIPSVSMFTGSLPAATTIVYSMGGITDTSYIAS
jgi:hypothetical protein